MRFFFILFCFLCFLSCEEDPAVPKSDVSEAVAILEPALLSDVMGTVIFKRADRGVEITVDCVGLSPGDHGLYVHMGKACAAPGEHTKLGEIVADSQGSVKMHWTDLSVRLNGEDSIVSHVVTVMEGDEIAACGVVKVTR